MSWPARLWARWRTWHQDTADPSPLARFDDMLLPPGSEALIYEERGDLMNPQTRPDWPPAGPTSAYPEAAERQTDGNATDSGEDS